MGKIFICSIEKLTQVLIKEGHPNLGLTTLPGEVDTTTPELYDEGRAVRFV